MLYIPFHKYNYVGGPSTFMQNLKKYLDESNFKYSDEYKKGDDIFFAIKYNLNKLNRVKRENKTVIQRLDGPQLNKIKRKPVKFIYRNYTDFVIFQSEYSRKACFKILGKIPANKYEVIINGVDKNIFFPDDNLKISKTIRFVTTGNLIQRYKLEPIILALEKIKDQVLFEFHVIGPVSEKTKEFLEKDYVKYYGSQSLKKTGEILRKCHVFLFSVINPPCPNSVIEAISTGLPVVSFNSGSMSELCWFSKDLLVKMPNKFFHRQDDFNVDKLANKIIFTVKNFNFFRQRALKFSHLYSFNECGNKYKDIFENIKNIKTKKKLSLRLYFLLNHIINNKYSKSFLSLFMQK